MDNINPCKGCTLRSVGCHAMCQAYDRWRQEEKERKAYERKNRFIISENDFVAPGRRGRSIRQ